MILGFTIFLDITPKAQFHGKKIDKLNLIKIKNFCSMTLLRKSKDKPKLREKCNERFEKFYQLHNLEVSRLSGHKNLSSIAI